jgi:hypothetical protein
MSALALLFAAAHATGLPPQEALQVVDGDCARVETVERTLRITFDVESGACAPGGPCSSWIESHVNPRELVVRRLDCQEPFAGRWVRDGACGERPRWKWTGRLDAGHAHDVGRDFRGGLGRVTMGGAESTKACLPETPKRGAVKTAVETTRGFSPQWVAFPAEGYSVVETPEGARLRWTPGPRLRQWLNGEPDAVADSDPMPLEEARTWLAGARVEPTGLAVRHTPVEYREWFEGWKQRKTLFCERVLEMDLEQRLRPAIDGQAESPPMRATTRLRGPAPVARCFPEDAAD